MDADADVAETIAIVRVGHVRGCVDTRCNSRERTKGGAGIDSLLTTEDMARLLACTRAAVRKWRAQGRLRAVKVGRLVRYRAGDLANIAARGL